MATDEPMSKMTSVAPKRSMTTVTNTANTLCKRVTKTADEDKFAVILDGLQEATKEYVSIMLEKLELNEILSHTPAASFLYRLDWQTLFEVEASEVKKAEVKLKLPKLKFKPV